MNADTILRLVVVFLVGAVFGTAVTAELADRQYEADVAAWSETVQAAKADLLACEATKADLTDQLDGATALMGAIWEHECPPDYWCLSTPDGMVLSKAVPAIPEQCPKQCGCLWNQDGTIGATSCLDTSQ